MKNDFASLLEESFKKRKSLEPGTMYEAGVMSIKTDYTFMQTVQGNIKGIISNSEFAEEGISLEKGKIYSVYFLREDHGDYYFTTVLTGDDITAENISLAQEKQIPILGQFGIEAGNNSGYEVKLGEYSALCPYSQMDQELKGKNITGKKFKFIVGESNSKSKKIIVSQKKISDKQRDLKREILREELKEGSYVTCIIKSIHKFGLIVDMNGIDALVPASESSFKKNMDLEKEFQIGQTVSGKVLSLDWKENKFSVSLKEQSNDPWFQKIPYKEGDILKAKIESLKTFGLFVKLDDHFHGLIPNKETGLPIRSVLSSHFKVGEELDVFITEVNPTKRQIALSIVKAKDAKDRLDFESYMTEQKPEAVSSFGLLLQKKLKK
jgi:ribosomal protein S1